PPGRRPPPPHRVRQLRQGRGLRRFPPGAGAPSRRDEHGLRDCGPRRRPAGRLRRLPRLRRLLGAPSGDGFRPPERDHAARCRVLSRPHIDGYGGGRVGATSPREPSAPAGIAWCSRPGSSKISPEEAPVTPDEQLWGPPRRRVPLSRSMLVNFMGLALALLVVATEIRVVTLWPKGLKGHVRGFGSAKTHAAVVKRVAEITYRCTGAHDFRRIPIVIEFVIPTILRGRSPTEVAIFGAFAVMLVTMPLSYGLGAKMMAAYLGTAASLLLAAGLAAACAHLAHLSGVSSDESVYLGATSHLSLQGLLIAGMVIGALGVLVDLTVSQASTVIALRRANPALGFRALYSGALEVGHDHIAATVNTLVFAYAGASLPVLLIFAIGGTSFTDAINGEAVAEEVVAALVGSIGLIASMP